MTIVCMTITYGAVVLRLIIRYCLHQKYGWDDWFIIAAAVSHLSTSQYWTSTNFYV
jgi:hypothetical protein